MFKQSKFTVSKSEQSFTTTESVTMGGQTVVRQTVRQTYTSGDNLNGTTSVRTITTEELTPEEFEKLALGNGPESKSQHSQEKSKGGLFSGLRKPAIFQKTKDKHEICDPKSTANGAKSKMDSAANSAKTAGTSYSTGDFEKDCLKAHNEYRAKHGVPPLKLSKELCAFAKDWAETIAKKDSSMHRPNNKYGENIYMKWSSDPNHQITGRDPVESWYSEIKDHVFGQEPRSLKSGHFTQVIWKGSTEVGMAQARSKSGKIFVVANYNPAGNMLGDFTANVPPPRG